LSNPPQVITFNRHLLTAAETKRAETEYARGIAADRALFREQEPGYHIRPTLRLELRAIMLESGKPGTPGAFPKWPAGLVLMRQAGMSVERLFSIVTPPRAAELDDLIAKLHPLVIAWHVFEQAFKDGELLYADVFALRTR